MAVEPEVYWRKARLSSLIWGSSHFSAKFSGIWSVANQPKLSNSGVSEVRGSRLEMIDLVARAILALLSLIIVWMRSRERFGLGG